MLPGLRYANTRPGLARCRELLEARGTDVLTLDYAYNTNETFMNAPDDEQLAWIGDDAATAFRAVAQMEDYSSFTVVGKSLGTIGMGWGFSALPSNKPTRLIWLTPSLVETGLGERMFALKGRSIIVIGTLDPGYNPSVLEHFDAHGMEVVVLEGVNHGLERPDDPIGTEAALNEMTDRLSNWLDQPAA